MPSKCNRCGKEIKWPVPFVQGNKPLNTDDTPHLCQTQEQLPGNSQPTKPKVTIEIVHVEAETIVKKYKDLTDAKFESICKFFISRMMSR